MVAHESRPFVAGPTAMRSATWFREPWLPGLLLFLEAALFMTAIMLASAMAPNLDLRAGAISDLGVIPETAVVFNVSLVLTGLLNLAAGVLLWLGHARGWQLAVFIAAGVGAIGAGSVPLDRGDAHSLFALVAFVAFNLEAIATSRLVRGPMTVIAIAAGTVGLAFVALMVVGDSGDPAVFGPIGHGGAERMIVYPVMLWLLALGGYLMGQRRDG